MDEERTEDGAQQGRGEQHMGGEEVRAQLDARLGLSRLSVFLLPGGGLPPSGASVRVSWLISSPSLLDWIGLFPLGGSNVDGRCPVPGGFGQFPVGPPSITCPDPSPSPEETDPLHFMDYRGFGAFGTLRGSIDWPIGEETLRREREQEQDATNNNAQEGGPTAALLQFRYCDGVTGAVKARSPPLLVFRDAQLCISAIACRPLCAAKSPQFYAKLCSSYCPGLYRTALSADGQWPSLNFLFPADRSAELRVRIKERGWPKGRLLGEATLPQMDLLDGAHKGKCCSLLLRPSLRHQVLIWCRLVPPVRQPLQETMHALSSPDKRAHSPDSNGNHNLLLPLPSSSSSSSASSQMAQSLCSSASILSSSSHLPPGWEVRIDVKGRLLYVDHNRQKTTWTPPVVLESADREGNNVQSAFGELQRSNRRTVVARKREGEQELDTRNGNNADRSRQEGEHEQRALRFLLRDDMFGQLMAQNEVSLRLYNGSAYLKHIIQRIRREPAKFAHFKANRELVAFLNSFADQTQPLPVGWQFAHDCGPFGQRLFVDHANRRITPIDPRLPEWSEEEQRVRQHRKTAKSAPPVRRRNRNGGETAARTAERGGDRGIWSWEIAERADEIHALLAKRCPEIADRVHKKLRLIGKVGELALLRFANDLDLIRAISILEQREREGPESEGEGNAQKAGDSLEQRVAHFHKCLERAGYGKGPGKIRLRLRRDQLMNDAFEKLLAVNPAQVLDITPTKPSTKVPFPMRKCQIMVSFDCEDGLDYGGPSRELFFLLSRELFHPKHGLFEFSGPNSHTVQISAFSKFVDQHLKWMELCGRVIGLALLHRCLLDTFFTRPFHKMLAQLPLHLDDLSDLDPQLHHSLLWMRKNPVDEGLDLTFCVTEDLAGELNERELLPGGKGIAVTDSNKEEFIARMLKWRVQQGVEAQSGALLRGLYAIVDKEYLRVFDPEQLELVLSGSVEVDIGDWRANTEYRGGYHPNHVVVRWFWECVVAMCNSDRLRLLQFVTGSSSVPFEGFKSLRGSDGPKRFCIERWGDEVSLPRAHTCFNRLDLPPYANRKTLLAKLMLAITESSSYAIE